MLKQQNVNCGDEKCKDKIEYISILRTKVILILSSFHNFMISKEWFVKGKSVKDKCKMDFREQWVAIVAKKYNICPNRRMKCGTRSDISTRLQYKRY